MYYINKYVCICVYIHICTLLHSLQSHDLKKSSRIYIVKAPSMSGFGGSLNCSTLNWTLYNILHVPLKTLVLVPKVGKYIHILKTFCRNHHQGQVLPEVKLSLGNPGLT